MILEFLGVGIFINLARCAIPTETTLTLVKLSPSTDNACIGMTYKLKLTASFTAGLTENVTIEILPSLNDTVFASVNNPDVDTYTVGSNLATPQYPSWVEEGVKDRAPEYLDPNLAIFYHTRVALTLGNVVNNNVSTDEKESQITIEFEVVMISMGSQTDGSGFWISTGMEFTLNNGEHIWISMYQVNLTCTTNLTKTPSISTTSLDTISIMEPKTVTITLVLPYGSSSVKVEALTVTENISPIHALLLKVASVGQAFSYSVDPSYLFTDGTSTCPLPGSLELSMGPLINKDAYEANTTDAASTITIEVLYQVESLSVIDEEFTIGFGVEINGQEIGVSSLNTTVTAQSSPPAFTSFTSGPGLVSHKVAPGFYGIAMVELTLPQKFSQSVTITLDASPVDGAAAALSILSVILEEFASSMACQIENGSLTTTKSNSSSAINDGATYVFDVFNMENMESLSNSTNILKILVAVMIVPDDAVNEFDKHNLDITITADGSSVGPQTVGFEVGAPRSYDTNVTYDFQLERSCASGIYETGSEVDFKLTMTTDRGKTPGEVTFELLLPKELENASLAFVSAKWISKGKNVVCLQLGNATATLSSWPGSDDNDRAVLVFPVMCNFEVVNDTAEDTATLLIRAKLKDRVVLLGDDEPDLQTGIGVLFSETQIWIGIITIETRKPTNLSEVNEVTGVIFATADIALVFPSGIVLQWSVDNIVYYDSPFENVTFQGYYDSDSQSPDYTIIATAQQSSWIASPTVDGDNTIYRITKPILAQYVRLVNRNGTCRVNYTVESNPDVAVYGSPESSKTYMANMMLAMDNDRNTCMNLPYSTDTHRSPYFWIQMNATIIGLNGTSPYRVQIIGEDLSCKLRGQSQVTQLKYPKSAPDGSFVGTHVLCANEGTPEVSSIDGKTTCVYNCDCTAAGITNGQCNNVHLFLIHTGAPSNYTLCEFSVLP